MIIKKKFVGAALGVILLWTSAANAALKVYWVDSGTGVVRRSNPDGTGPQTVVTGLSVPTGIANDTISQQIFWITNGVNPRIQRASYDGAGVQTVLSLGAGGRDIAIDTVARKMYWLSQDADVSARGLRRANLDGSNVQVVYNDPYIVGNTASAPGGLALDLAAGKVYWTDIALNKVMRANLDGTSPQNVVTDQHFASSAFAIDADAAIGKIYWSSGTFNDAGNLTGGINRANLDGSASQSIQTASESRPGIDIDAAGGKVYWTSSGTSAVLRSNLDGSGVQTLASGSADVFGIELIDVPEPGAVSMFIAVLVGSLARRRHR